ncbi:hypothetical protein [Nostoc sp. CALU 546]|uniref:hypothetical protein n=1 Tax=Nostoc sp. CALU 546 TaxID=1867241 RepID=UPI003B67952C
MSNFLVENALETIKRLTAGFNNEEKAELLKQLPSALGISTPATEASSGQHQQQTNTMSGVNQSGGGSSSINFAPVQAGRDATSSTTFTQPTTQNKTPELQEALRLLVQLKQEIDQNSELNPLLKPGAKQEIDKLQQELQKDEPDKSLVKHTIEILKQGLEGVITLAKPVTDVAVLVGKVWGTLIL